MAQMRLATATFHLRPLHAMTMVGRIDDAGLAYRLVEAGPATAALELGIAAEKRVAAYRAIEGSDLLGILERTAPGTFRSFVPGDVIDVLRQDLLPFVV